MNANEKQTETRKLLNLITFNGRVGNYKGFLNIKPNTYAHELAKFNICYFLIKQGYHILTEAPLVSGGIPDIIAIKDGKGMIVEVLNSEKEKIKKLDHNPKIDKYPEEFLFLEVDCKDYQSEVTQF